MPADHVLVDTNILLEATDERRAHHQAATDLLSNRPHLRLCAQVIREYLVVATRPAARSANGLGMTRQDALENVRAFRERMRLLPEEKPLLPALFALMESVPCAGKRIHDANLVACAIVHGIRHVVTLNAADFRGFAAHITVVSLDAIRA
jgi:predicted nucleic acid-binding protein